MLKPDFKGGLLPVIVQDHATKEVLMFAYMSPEAYEMTLSTGLAHYYSRSRGKLWKKGETSGHFQRVIETRIDCDNDCLLLLVEQDTAACHTGYRSCFYRTLNGNVVGEKLFDPENKYGTR